MSDALTKRVFCGECGSVRIRQGRSRHAVCPEGHGRLVAAFTLRERRKAIVTALPQARRIHRHAFEITGREGLFDYPAGSGRRPVEPNASVQADELVACYYTGTRTLVRVFCQKPTSQPNVS
jgi:hypothetical protein